MFWGKVFISKNMNYQIYSTVRSQLPHGEILSLTEIDRTDSSVTVFDSGRVIIKTPDKRVEYDMNTGNIVVL
ncbi:hypothetical protein JXQ70_05190 [bacterium]|nr:hypothetical protein [bacterium]